MRRVRATYRGAAKTSQPTMKISLTKLAAEQRTSYMDVGLA